MSADYKIAIPSYKRDQTVKNKTLKVLEEYDISPELVTIFVANEEEHDRYKSTLKDTRWKNIEIGKPGLSKVRNHIRTFYPEGTKLVNLDDDLMQILHRVDEKTLKPVPNLSKDVFERGFDLLGEHNAFIWGIYAASNPFFMKKDASVGLYYIIGSCWGHIVRHDIDLILSLEDKEDFERTLQYYSKDGRVVRLDNITVKSMYYTEPGGMQVERTSERIHKSAEYLASKYPGLCTMYIRKTTGHAELRLRDTIGLANTGATLNDFFGD
jgi:hypothetical protein